jgi:uncharacterized protein (DUF58 family)
MSARLDRPRVWVLPNRNTVGLAAVLVAMWYAGASQSNGAAYLLCFVLASVAAVSTVHAWANLRGVAISADSIPPAFAGDQLLVTVSAGTDRDRAHRAISLRSVDGAEAIHFMEIGPGTPQQARVEIPAARRGCFREIYLHASSIYPLGFFTARKRIVVPAVHFIYPKLAGDLPLPRSLAPARKRRDGLRVEGEDFGGVRSWRPGESQRHIDWKAASRGQPLLIKQWTGEADEMMVFDWQALAPLDTEARLSQLARWVVLAERAGASYGLRLPGNRIAPSSGDAHFHACLRALAVFENADSESEGAAA